MNNDISDIFEREQSIYDNAISFSQSLEDGKFVQTDTFVQLAKDYGRLLKQLRRVTKISDRATENLNLSKLNLLDQVHYDVLTGIYNRRYFEEVFKELLHEALQNKTGVSVMMIDVDFFKNYNDTYGHSEGDKCLRMVASAIAEGLVKSNDFVARYGGEEFVVVLPDSDATFARDVANRILDNIRILGIPHSTNAAAPYVTVSIGLTTFCVAEGHKWEDYVKCADVALYASKRGGKNKYTFFDYKEE